MRKANTLTIDVGDIELAAVHWPGSGDPVVMLHATGFHSRCWTQVVHDLPQHDIYAIDLRFHGKSDDAGVVDWGVMAHDIEVALQKLGLTNVLGVGHSIGGHLLARVAAKVPDAFKHLVLIDPVIMSPQRYEKFGELAEGFSAGDHPVSKRKNSWVNAEEMYKRFIDRAPFNTWVPAVLRDYCDYALKPPGPDGFHQLACDPLNEAGIYMHQNGNEAVLKLLPQITTAVTLLRAPPNSSEQPDLSVSPTWPELAGSLPNCTEVLLEELNHFIPMQRPDLVADYIRAVP